MIPLVYEDPYFPNSIPELMECELVCKNIAEHITKCKPVFLGEVAKILHVLDIRDELKVTIMRCIVLRFTDCFVNHPEDWIIQYTYGKTS